MEFSLNFLKCYGVESKRWAKDFILHSSVFSVDCIGVYIISFMPWDGCFYMYQRGYVELFCKFSGVLHRHLKKCGFGFHQRAWRRGLLEFLEFGIGACIIVYFLPLKREFWDRLGNR